MACASRAFGAHLEPEGGGAFDCRETPTERNIQVAVAEFLVWQHFSVSMSERFDEGKPGIGASSGSCRILVLKSPALGWDRDLIRRYADTKIEFLLCSGGGSTPISHLSDGIRRAVVAFSARTRYSGVAQSGACGGGEDKL